MAHHKDAESPTGISAKICRFIVYHPCIVVFGSFGVMFALTASVIATNMMTLTPQGRYDWTISSDPTSIAIDAYTSARSQTDDFIYPVSRRLAQSANSSQVLERSESVYSMFFLYDWAKQSTIFTPKNLQEMCQVEQVLLKHPEYPKFCRLAHPPPVGVGALPSASAGAPAPSSPSCAAPQTSVVSLFYPGANRTCNLLSSSSVTSTLSAITTQLGTNRGRLRLGFFMSKHVLDKGYTALTRSLLSLGAPLPGYSSAEDREEEQEAAYEKFLDSVEADLQAHFGMTRGFMRSPYSSGAGRAGEVSVRFYGGYWRGNEFSSLMNSDFMFPLVSIVFVYVYITFHTQSLLLSSLGMLQILMSLPVAFFFYRVLLGITYYTQLHILAIFLVLGVGADDIFVFVDAWRQHEDAAAGKSGKEALLARMYGTYSRTVQAVFNTSFTTAIAFVATAISPIMPVSSFGIYAAFCIMFNYLFVITITPAAVVLWNERFHPDTPPCCCFRRMCCPKRNRAVIAVKERPQQSGGTPMRVVDMEEGMEEAAAAAAAAGAGASGGGAGAGDGSGTVGAEQVVPFEAEGGGGQQQQQQGQGKGKATLADRFFDKVYVPAITYTVGGSAQPDGSTKGGVKVVAWAVFLLSCAYMAQAAYYAAQLTPPSALPEWFSPSHMYYGITDLLSTGFLTGQENAYVWLSFTLGIAGLDRSKFVQWTPGENRGDAVWDDKFDLSSAAAQNYVTSLCGSLASAPCSAIGCSGGFNTLAFGGEVNCPTTAFHDWFATVRNASTILAAYPSPAAAVAASALPTPQLQKAAAFLATPAAAALPAVPATDAFPVGAQFLPWITAYRVQSKDEAIGIVGGKLRFVVIHFKSTLLTNQPTTTRLSVYDAVAAFLAEQLSKAPASVSSILQLGHGQFTWMRTEQGLITGMFTGLMICFPVSFLVLVSATGNVLLSLYAVLTIAGIVTSVLGFIKSAMGWELGIAESIAAVIVIGFSVDYVVHLGHMYHENDATDRVGRTVASARHMGVTVVAGAITTLGSGVVMWLCQITFFTKMAVLISMTIVFSFVHSLGMFMCVCVLFGPQGNVGSVTACWAAVTGKGKAADSSRQ